MVGHFKRVLEVGCGPGSVTKLLTQHGQCRVTGLDLDSEAIDRVAPYCEAIVRGDLNSPEWPSLLDKVKPFDVVVAADVLEHLYDPWSVLHRWQALSDLMVISSSHCPMSAMPQLRRA